LVTTCLLDVNVLVALVWENHEHHEVAWCWMGERAARRWATCTVTQLGFLRLSSNPRVIANAVTVRGALDLLARLVSHPRHVFWSDQEGVLTALGDAADLRGYRQITDAYLLGLARRHGGKLATLDRGFLGAEPKGTSKRSALEVVSVVP
jgi:uncharacterized protein